MIFLNVLEIYWPRMHTDNHSKSISAFVIYSHVNLSYYNLFLKDPHLSEWLRSAKWAIFSGISLSVCILAKYENVLPGNELEIFRLNKTTQANISK
jgi:hypothetical protein